jgi:uncharacterized membrane-anchored protein
MEHEAFYATIVQVVPVLWVVLLFDSRALVAGDKPMLMLGSIALVCGFIALMFSIAALFNGTDAELTRTIALWNFTLSLAGTVGFMGVHILYRLLKATTPKETAQIRPQALT